MFRAKRADRVKLIYWDGTGACLFAKRLQDGKFRWPKAQDGVMRVVEGARLEAGSHGRHRRQYSRDDCGTVNQRARNARDARCMF
jgi:hypothetical protein